MDIARLVGNAEQQEEGVWLPYIADVQFKLAYGQRRMARNFFSKEYAKARRKMGGNREPAPEVTNRITIDMLAKFVLKGWQGLTDKGEPIEFTEAAAKQLLEQSAPIRDFISTEANDIENFGGDLSDEEKETAEGTGDAAQAAIKSGASVEP